MPNFPLEFPKSVNELPEKKITHCQTFDVSEIVTMSMNSQNVQLQIKLVQIQLVLISAPQCPRSNHNEK